MNPWTLIIAAVVTAWLVLRLFATERLVRVSKMETDHLRQLAEEAAAQRDKKIHIS